jgi:peptide/nickel transport system substrate-binding protein
MRRFNALATGAVAAAIAAAMPSHVTAGPQDNSLVWATDRELNVPLVWWTSTTEVAALMYHMFDNLVYRDPETFEYKPLLATSWKWIDDKTIEFKLREDVVFHNGKKFNADDVVSTYNLLIKPEAAVLNRQLVSWMAGADKIDDTTVRIRMQAPFPAALEFLAGSRMAILPAGIWDTARKDATGKPDYSSVAPIGTGPYKVTEWVPGDRAVLTRNDSYFDGAKGKPAIKTLIFRTITDAETRIAELATGAIDWITDIARDKADDLAGMPGIKVVDGPDLRVSYLQFDVVGRAGKNPVNDLKVRQAIAHAIDRAAIAKNLVGTSSRVVHSACYPDQVGCAQDVPRYDYDPAAAKRLLAEAGYPNGFEIDLNAYREREYTEATIGYLRAVGIKANLRYLQWQALRTQIQDGKAAFSHMSWASSGLNDVSAITSVYFKHSRDDYCRDDQIKAWLDEGDRTIEPKARAEAYRKALVRIQEKLCWLPMFSYAKNYAYNDKLEFKPTADGFPLFFLARWK